MEAGLCLGDCRVRGANKNEEPDPVRVLQSSRIPGGRRRGKRHRIRGYRRLIAVALIAVLSPTDSGIVGGLKAFFDGVGTKVGGLAPE